jgi:predicted nucleotidyltransferase
MIDFSQSPAHEFGGLCEVLQELRSGKSGLDNVMVVGASARDLMHRSLGFDFPLRSTTDIDIGLAVPDRAAYMSVVSAYPSTGNTGIRFRIAEMSVDIVPFGAIEDPIGTSKPTADQHPIDVFGFNEVFAAADVYLLPGGSEVHVPSPAGYCALKIKAWIDRSPNSWFKDAADMAYICYWYQESKTLFNRLYDENSDLVQAASFDSDVGSMLMLARDIRLILGSALAAQLEALWDSSSRRKMASSETSDLILRSNRNSEFEHRLKNYDLIHGNLTTK